MSNQAIMIMPNKLRLDKKSKGKEPEQTTSKINLIKAIGKYKKEYKKRKQNYQIVQILKFWLIKML